jgi:hypothetical protein
MKRLDALCSPSASLDALVDLIVIIFIIFGVLRMTWLQTLERWKTATDPTPFQRKVERPPQDGRS